MERKFKSIWYVEVSYASYRKYSNKCNDKDMPKNQNDNDNDIDNRTYFYYKS